jgi:DNA-3-methyladenine glycosylase II
MMALGRTDCFPTGDIALINSIKQVKQLAKETSKEEILSIANEWKPYRTIAAYLLWWAYIKQKNIKW